ncbi:hypothetical protein CXB51_014875 [Gossypium anomalum]|uniref:Uncharacterized protein n=1 Tax=Gossypium anomalum TaxID=47600 RepID=A0A8J6D2V5_9ROSI|nr:hypothetical protein CXB51_014875 [Gossypium anomalum]
MAAALRNKEERKRERKEKKKNDKGGDNSCSHFVPTAINVAIKELISVVTPGQDWLLFIFAIIFFAATFTQWLLIEMLFMMFFAVDWKYLDCDKQSTKSAVLMNLESGMVASEDIAKQVSTYGERYGYLQGSYLSFIARAMTLLVSCFS